MSRDCRMISGSVTVSRSEPDIKAPDDWEVEP